jgi:hypothetical protein
MITGKKTLFLLTLVSSAVLASAAVQTPEVNVGVNESQVTYKGQTGEFAKHQGYLHGFTVQMRYPPTQQLPVQFAVDFTFAQGRVDYQTHAATYAADSKDRLYNIVGTVARTVPFEGKQIISYTGFGFRNYRDNAEAVTSSTGNQGYDSRFSTLYTPIGVRSAVGQFGGWHVTANAEYQYFWTDTQKTYVSTTPYTEENNKGYGARFGFDMQQRTAYGDVTVNPYYQYWNHKHANQGSVSAQVAPGTGQVTAFNFPQVGRSTEAGIAFSIRVA